ncbi:hypothetical protein BJ165DRAFT_1591303 [Panaeolus papilionaceus]|nr:hypothetical protein BJ165DRAFT_1591303 [Panaeolus papilionaceus]
MSEPTGTPIDESQHYSDLNYQRDAPRELDLHCTGTENDKQLPLLAHQLSVVKGVCDIVMAFSLMFVPRLLYNGPFMEVLSDLTTLPTTSGTTNPSSAFEIGTLLLGMGVAGVVAGKERSRGAIKTVATMAGITSLAGLSICMLSPYKHATTFILFLALMNVAWYTVVVRAGQLGVAETLGLGWGLGMMCKCGRGMRGRRSETRGRQGYGVVHSGEGVDEKTG